MSSTVNLKLSQILKPRVAFPAVAQPPLLVLTPVLLQPDHLPEGIPAQRATKGTLAVWQVHRLVLLQRRLLSEALAALVTLMRTFARVDRQVHHQMVLVV